MTGKEKSALAISNMIQGAQNIGAWQGQTPLVYSSGKVESLSWRNQAGLFSTSLTGPQAYPERLPLAFAGGVRYEDVGHRLLDAVRQGRRARRTSLQEGIKPFRREAEFALPYR